MSNCFRQIDAFPIIARVIREMSQREGRFISHRDIVQRLLEDPEAKSLIEHAYQQQEGNQSREWMANNMVSWFSQRITIGCSDWEASFERTRTNGMWAYRSLEVRTSKSPA